MLFSMNWAKDFINIKDDAESIAKKLTMVGFNAASVEHLGKEIKGVFIGQILEITNHPEADRLRIAKVDIKDRILTIITAAKNIKKGDKVVVAVPGAELFNGKKIGKMEFYGVVSEGMLCSASELGMDDHGLPEEMREGLLILPQDAPVGADFKEYFPLEDSVIEFELTPNRPDCFSILGIAREIAAVYNEKLEYPSISLKEEGSGEIHKKIKIDIKDKDLCFRYVARIIEDIKVGPSPLWLQRRLQACGVRPINNIVDVTNYVMLELGQPLHAFDYEKIKGREIIVRRAQKGETIKTLDGRLRELNEEILVIADKERPLAIAGIMGGENSEIKENTKTVLLESAVFYGPNIRRTGRTLGLRTEASVRFEKGLDPEIALLASERACELIEKLGIGRVAKGYIDVYPNPQEKVRLKLDYDKINKLLGTNIPLEKMIEILVKLNFKVEKNDEIYVEAPSYRKDITCTADIAEEIARVYGYDNIPSSLPSNISTIGKIKKFHRLKSKIENILICNGFSEVYNYSIINPKMMDMVKAPEEHEHKRLISIINPLSEEMSVLRTTLIPGIVDVVKYNINQKIDEVKVFEIGKTYHPKSLPLKELPVEKTRIALGLYGKDYDFYEIKRVLETVFFALRVKDAKFKKTEYYALHPGRSAAFYIDDDLIGVVGELHHDVAENYCLEGKRIYVAEIDFDLLIEKSDEVIQYTPLPKFPPAERDLAFVLDDDVPVAEVIEAIKEVSRPLLERIELFDIYKGEKIPAGKKSVAFSLTFRSYERTLKDEEVNELQEKIISIVEERFGGKLRES
ncbi:MAG: phenylalanine--tRNA ligase subunit beta [Thermovenabulum sp.]|uniref:phenylalanine--tRNA ligase subunit beta n=1 Tax=Thermovenabulum sp. TaxID=3100335 RepID=UPI003C7D4B04